MDTRGYDEVEVATMSASSPMIALPEQLMKQAARRAGSLGVSTEQWLATTVSERIRLEEQTAVFFAERASRRLAVLYQRF
jgi:hypothetical protein